ncbi:MAG: bifunctional pyr operon transcriptional regulator/uracil phosphoribosyltransferase PyrR [Gemmatimonadota bacterium]
MGALIARQVSGILAAQSARSGLPSAQESTEGGTRTPVLSEEESKATLARLADEVGKGGEINDLVLVGIRRRGDHLAARLASHLLSRHETDVPTGSLDITLYRDDFAQIGPRPIIGVTDIPVDLTDRRVVVVDDVLFTGRTIRAALNELADFGRPRRIELCVLIDRGGRELPIHADYVGTTVEVGVGQRVVVHVPEEDGELGAFLESEQEAG